MTDGSRNRRVARALRDWCEGTADADCSLGAWALSLVMVTASASDCRDSTAHGIEENLIDLIDRPGCADLSDDEGEFECSSCGWRGRVEGVMEDGDGRRLTADDDRPWERFKVAFCPRCGGEVEPL